MPCSWGTPKAFLVERTKGAHQEEPVNTPFYQLCDGPGRAYYCPFKRGTGTRSLRGLPGARSLEQKGLRACSNMGFNDLGILAR